MTCVSFSERFLLPSLTMGLFGLDSILAFPFAGAGESENASESDLSPLGGLDLHFFMRRLNSANSGSGKDGKSESSATTPKKRWSKNADSNAKNDKQDLNLNNKQNQSDRTNDNLLLITGNSSGHENWNSSLKHSAKITGGKLNINADIDALDNRSLDKLTSEDATCVDNDYALKSIITSFTGNELGSNIYLLHSCLQLRELTMDPTRFRNVFQKMLGWAVIPENVCSADLGEECRAFAADVSGRSATSCSFWDGKTVGSSACCKSCAWLASNHTGAYADNESYTMGMPFLEGDAKPLVHFLTSLGYRNHTTAKPICFWDGISCYAKPLPSYYTISLSNARLHGFLDASIGKLKHLRWLYLSRNRIRGQLQDIVSIIGGDLHGLDVSHNALQGTFPPQWERIQQIIIFNVAGNEITGTIDQNFFDECIKCQEIDLSDNRLEGVIPKIGGPNFQIFSASRNRFTSWAGFVSRPDNFHRIQLEFDDNHFSLLPPSMKHLEFAESISLRNNLISSIPSWGDYRKDELTKSWFEHTLSIPRDQLVKCWHTRHKFDKDAIVLDVEPPSMPNLRKFELSGNQLGNSLTDLLIFLSYAPLLSAIQCENCNLTGSVPGYELAHVSLAQKSRDCKNIETFANLQYLNLASNPGIDCQIIKLDAGMKPPLRCTTCPELMRLPADQVKPQADEFRCVCIGSLHNYQKKDVNETCGCADGKFMSKTLNECKPCQAGSENCAWHDDATRSRRPPLLKAGYWASCQNMGNSFVGHDTFKCYSERTCLGWPQPFGFSNCLEDSQCAAGRGGRACSLCLPEFTGGPDGECRRCNDTTRVYRRRLVFIAVLSLPVLLACMHLFGNMKRRALARSVRRLRNLMRQSLKNLQLLGVLANMSLNWPAEVLVVLRMFNSVDIDIHLRIGCAMSSSSTTASMLCRWLLPIVFVLLSTLALLLSRVIAFCFRRPKITISLDMFVTFVYTVWSVFFNALLKNTFNLLTLVRSPNQKMMVVEFPHLESWSDEWRRLLPGVCSSFFFYVFMLIVVSRFAIIDVARSMKETHCKSRGAFEFTTDGLRDAKIHWHLYTMIKDIAINIMIVVFSGSGTSQLVSIVMIISFYAYKVGESMPYARTSFNVLELGTSLSAVFLLLLTGLNFDAQRILEQDEEGKGDAHAATLMVIILLSSLVGPALIIAYDMFFILVPPKVARRCPWWFRPETAADRSCQVPVVTAAVQSHPTHILSAMDQVEFSRFCKALYGRSSAIGADGEVIPPKGRFHWPSFEDSELGSVLDRHPYDNCVHDDSDELSPRPCDMIGTRITRMWHNMSSREERDDEERRLSKLSISSIYTRDPRLSTNTCITLGNVQSCKSSDATAGRARVSNGSRDIIERGGPSVVEVPPTYLGSPQSLTLASPNLASHTSFSIANDNVDAHSRKVDFEL